jgi:hypothetical protein
MAAFAPPEPGDAALFVVYRGMDRMLALIFVPLAWLKGDGGTNALLLLVQRRQQIEPG